MFGFEKLDVWRLAIEYSDDVSATTRSLPSDERFGLTNQLRRAPVSISSNIAEGSRRSSRKELGRFIEIAFGSLLTFPTKVVEHVFNVLETPRNRHVENVPHVRFGLLSETSLLETVSQLSIAIRQNFLDQANSDRLYAAAERLSRLLSGLKNSLNS